jgi:hypothetical protein
MKALDVTFMWIRMCTGCERARGASRFRSVRVCRSARRSDAGTRSCPRWEQRHASPPASPAASSGEKLTRCCQVTLVRGLELLGIDSETFASDMKEVHEPVLPQL